MTSKLQQRSAVGPASKWLHTFTALGSVTATSLSCGLIGPSLLELKRLTSTSTSQISAIFCVRGLMALIGYFLLEPVLNRVNKQLIMATALLSISLLISLVPLAPNFALLLLTVGPPELLSGLVVAGAQLILIEIWPRKLSFFLQCLNIAALIGLAASPLLLQTARGCHGQSLTNVTANLGVHADGLSRSTRLDTDSQLDHQSSVSLSQLPPTSFPNVTGTNDINVDSHNSSDTSSTRGDSDISNTSCTRDTRDNNDTRRTNDTNATSCNKVETCVSCHGNESNTIGDFLADNTDAQIKGAYWIVGLFCFLVGLVLLVSWLTTVRECCQQLPQQDGQIQQQTRQETYTLQAVGLFFRSLAAYKRFSRKICGVFFWFSFSYGGLEMTYTSLLFYFTVDFIGWTPSLATWLLVTHHLVHLLTLCLTAWLCERLKPHFVLGLDLTVLTLALSLLAVCLSSHPTMLWVGVIVIASSLSSVVPASLTWLDSLSTAYDNRQVNAVFWAGYFSGYMTLPVISGTLYQYVHPSWFIYLTLCLAVLCIVAVFSILIVLKQQRLKDEQWLTSPWQMLPRSSSSRTRRPYRSTDELASRRVHTNVGSNQRRFDQETRSVHIPQSSPRYSM